MKQPSPCKTFSVTLLTASFAFLPALSAHADNHSSEMQDLVRQSQGLKPSDGSGEKKQADASKKVDPAAVYIEAGADADQATKIRDLQTNLEKINKAKVVEMIGLYKEMHELTIKPELDEPKILAAQTKLNALTSEMSMEKIRTLIGIRKVLTPKQRENLAAIIQKRRSPGPATTK